VRLLAAGGGETLYNERILMPPWMIASAIQLISSNTANSLTVEAALAEARHLQMPADVLQIGPLREQPVNLTQLADDLLR
jgi:hypothetical protein